MAVTPGSVDGTVDQRRQPFLAATNRREFVRTRVTMYARSMQFAVCDEKGPRLEPLAPLLAGGPE